jgi:hypothetical protein
MLRNKAFLGSLVPGARGSRPQYGHHFSEEGLVWGGAFAYFSRCREKRLAHLLDINYEEMKALVCEITYA